MKKEIFRMHNVTYYEKNILQLKDFNMHIFSGEILSLVPVNNQGLDALLFLFRQNAHLHSGFIYYKEKLINSWKNGGQGFSKISVIQNQSSLVEGATVFDNIFVLRAGFRSFLIRPKLLKQQLQPYFDELQLDISPSSYIDELSRFERLVVELIKAIVNGGKLVVLSEIGSFLSESDLARYVKIIRHYAQKGISFLYIAYHFEEIRSFSDRTIVLRNGTILKTVCPSDILTYTIDYRDDVRNDIQRKQPLETNPIFYAKEIYSGSINGLTFSVSRGECIVIHTLTAQIYADILDVIKGAKKIERGEILLEGKPFDGTYSRKTAIINEHPTVSMLFSDMNYLDNLCITLDHKLPEIWVNNQVKKGLKREYAMSSDVTFDKPVEELTIEEKYELIYNRILLQNPQIVFCLQPFNKADMNLRMHIRNLIKKLISQKIAVVILAVNLADSLSIADRLIRITTDSPTEIYEKKDFSNIPFSAPWVDLYKE